MFVKLDDKEINFSTDDLSDENKSILQNKLSNAVSEIRHKNARDKETIKRLSDYEIIKIYQEIKNEPLNYADLVIIELLLRILEKDKEEKEDDDDDEDVGLSQLAQRAIINGIGINPKPYISSPNIGISALRGITLHKNKRRGRKF